MTGDPLAPLAVLDRLEVGPARVEPRRVVARYAVSRDGAAEATELAYRFPEDVFGPGDPTAENLAAMAVAQVALNYGLFCDEIVFRGRYDAADRRFLREMAANTAREIYVKKFLEPNPFLTGPAAGLPAVRRESYLRARLLFPDAAGEGESGNGPGGGASGDWRPGPSPRGRADPPRWSAEPGRAAVLASGGKDSLLTLGLLEELGVEAHSVFVNESGRHWFTALNAHRHLARERPATTARVWTSSDRVFAWMLRHLPFVRPDFARLRSDEYPVRLWTVAVFLFGVLPVALRRGAGLVLVGDEFDTTRRARHGEIPHYDGLYDQSRWFDAALTRYYRRKGWPLRQLSILRPLSEPLIQKTLGERYAELQRHQVSCHAAHLEVGRVRPCGRCEKCRRIVGMLVAFGADPGRCGYTEEQVAACLEAWEGEGVHLEAPAAAHVGWLLQQAGRIGEAPGAGRRREVVRLRFHPDASPPGLVPEALRHRLYEILLAHAEGAVSREGRRWVDVDPLAAGFGTEEAGAASGRGRRGESEREEA